MEIGIAITVHNRNETAKETISKIKKLAPEGSKIVIVDDGSKIPFEDSTFRFNNSVGIAAAKNKCIELLYDLGCEHLFLFDDDIYPLVDDWHLRYINTGIKHLCFSFDKFSNGRTNGRIVNSIENGIIEYHEPCGCMLYLHRDCVDKVGGMDIRYGKWGYEHVGYSMRIHNSGLIPKPFLDIENSTKVFHSLDWEQTVKRSVPTKERINCVAKNKAKYISEIDSSKYIDFREPKNVIITTFFTTLGDTQRNGEKWSDDMRSLINPLKESCLKFGIDLVVLDDTVNITPKHSNPYFARWIAIKEHLEDNIYKNVWCVDATDVEVLRDPFNNIEHGFIYVGCEPSYTNSNAWLRKHHKSNYYRNLYNNRIPLKNAGILGGNKNMVLEFVERICNSINKVDKESLTDMALFNLIASFYGKQIKFGDLINTEFKAFKDNGKAIFKHK